MFEAFLNHAVTSQKASGAFGPILVSWNLPGTSISFFHLVNSDAYIRSPNMSSAHAIRCNYREVCKSTNRALAVAMVTGLSSGGLQCRAIYHFNKNYMWCFKGWDSGLTVIDIQFIWLHWMLLKDERLKWILSPDKVSFIFSCERCRLGLLYDIWCNLFTKDEKSLSGIMSHRNIIKLKAVYSFKGTPLFLEIG